MGSIVDIIPGYREAIRFESNLRIASFLGNTELLGGFKVYSLTPRLFSVLVAMESPLLVGGDVKLENIFSFIWVIKVKEENESPAEFFEKLKQTDLEQVVIDVEDYLKYSFVDSIKGNGSVDAPLVCPIASYVDILASEYGWGEQEILDIPYRRIIQYIRSITLRKTDGMSVVNEISGKCRIDFLRKQYEHN